MKAPTVQILLGDCRDTLAALPAESVQCVVTSPPYWGLRDYGIPPSIWGGRPACRHVWGETLLAKDSYAPGAKKRWQHDKSNGTHSRDAIAAERIQNTPQGQFCQLCGAWSGCLGLEPTPQLFVEHMVEVFEHVRRVLKRDGTLWLNLGDTYASNGGHSDKACNDRRGAYNLGNRPEHEHRELRTRGGAGLKPKDLVGIPWRVAFALQDAGWYLRSDIIWHKPNPMPESTKDRPTKAHEYLFLLSKSKRYYYDALAIREPASDTGRENGRDGRDEPREARPPGSNARTLKRLDYSAPRKVKVKAPSGWDQTDGAHGTIHRNGRTSAEYQEVEIPGGRNKRSVWTIPTFPYPDAHFATFPPDLVKPCVLAGSKPGDTILDPCSGSGTTGAVALELGRNAILCDINHEYTVLAQQRTNVTPGLPI